MENNYQLYLMSQIRVVDKKIGELEKEISNLLELSENLMIMLNKSQTGEEDETL